MSFKSIGDLAISVLAKLENEATEEGCAVEAHSLRPATGKRVATGHGEGAKPVAFAQDGEVAAEQTVNWKKTGANPRQLGGQEEQQTKTISRNWMAIAASLHDMRRCMGRETAARAPRAARPIHLCIDRGHAVTHPQATAR